MLKIGGSATKKGGQEVELMIIGLSHMNLDRLRQGMPIKCAGSDFGLAGNIEVVIFSGETEESMQREVAELFGKNTRVTIDLGG